MQYMWAYAQRIQIKTHRVGDINWWRHGVFGFGEKPCGGAVSAPEDGSPGRSEVVVLRY